MSDMGFTAHQHKKAISSEEDFFENASARV